MSDQIAADLKPVVEMLTRCGASFARRQSSMLSKPILGGCFGDGAYRMFSWVHDLTGLHAVTYYVVHADSLSIMGIGGTKAEALQGARDAVSVACPVRLNTLYALTKKSIAEEVAARAEAEQKAREEKHAAWLAQQAPAPAPTKLIPKRRRQVFEKSGGKCHYCGTTLTLDGRWHIEHCMPKALLGDNAPSNLVASCTSCNFEKRDLTDQEYLAKKGSRKRKAA